MTSAAAASPVRLQGQLDVTLNRWRWLVKWLLVIPHLILLFFLWIAFGVLTDRWVLRVSAYVGLMTDAYPPFRLDVGGSDPSIAVISSDTHATAARTWRPLCRSPRRSRC